jgi:antitoxin MazE
MAKAARLTIRQWGNSLAVRIPARVARAARFEVGQEVEVATHDGSVTVKPVGPRRLTLAQKLQQFDPAKHGGEAMAAEPVGAEIIK